MITHEQLIVKVERQQQEIRDLKRTVNHLLRVIGQLKHKTARANNIANSTLNMEKK